jgi:hypothetical protein
MRQWNIIVAYFSPETVLPLSSILATIAGCALMIRRSSVRFAVRAFRAALRRWRRRPIAQTKPPHLPIQAEPVSSKSVS